MGTCALLREHKAIDKVAQLWPVHCLRTHSSTAVYPGSDIMAAYSMPRH